MSVAEMALSIYAVNNGYMDDVPVEKIKTFEAGFQKFMEASLAPLLNTIATTKDLSSESEENLKKAILQFKQGFVLS